MVRTDFCVRSIKSASTSSGTFPGVRFLSVLTLVFLLLVVNVCGKKSPTSSSTPEPVPPPPPAPVPTSLTISPPSANFTQIGQVILLRATVFDQNNNILASANIVWSSSITEVATVSVQGLVTALKNGTTQITARSGSISAVAIATVAAPVPNRSPEAVGMIEDRELTEGGSSVEVDVSSAFRDPDGDELSFEAESGDDRVATTSTAGSTVTIRPESAGSTTVTVTAKDPGGLTATQNIAVTVHPPENQPPEAVGTIEARELTEGGSSVEMDVSSAFLDPDGDELSFEAESGDDQVATTSTSGSTVTIRPKSAGSTTVTVTAKDPGGLTATQNIDVQVIGPRSDRAALIAIYNATDGPNWSNNTNWLSNAPLDRWYGVETDFRGRVISLDLIDNQLSGPIPSAIRDLTELNYLRLVTNQLSGPIPPELGRLNNLEDLWLSSNQLSGPIPSQLGHLVNLQDLGLASNQLSGPVPPELGNLTKLWRLFLNDNPLSGPLPHELVQLDDLFQLHLENTDLCVPNNTEFQSWLRGISDREFSYCVEEGMPSISMQIPDRTIRPGAEISVNVSDAFSDPDGDELEYSAVSDDTDVATTSVQGDSVKVVGVAVGNADITVTATDPGGLSVSQTFTVMVKNDDSDDDDGDDELSFDIRYCEARPFIPGINTGTWNVSMGGRVTAHRHVFSVRTDGYANDQFVSSAFLGNMNPGETKSYAIYSVVALTGTTLTCEVTVSWRGSPFSSQSRTLQDHSHAVEIPVLDQ